MGRGGRRAALSACLGVLLFPACATPGTRSAPGSGERVWTAVDEEIRRFQAQRGVPGMSVAVLSGQDVVFLRGYGWANRERQTPVTPMTMFSIGSIEKEFTAAAVMRLVERGRLRLEDPITTYLPDLDTGGEVVAIKDMLHMVSGLQEEDTLGTGLRDPAAAARRGRPSARTAGIRAGLGFDPDADVAAFRGERLYHAPRERWCYSQPNYDLMSLVIADRSGKPYYDVIGELAAAAGMERFHPNWTPPPPPEDPGVAHGYRRQGDRVEPFWEENTGAGWATAVDLARWGRALETGAVVSRESYAEMTTPATMRDGRTWPYGLGLMLTTFEGRPKIMHTGSLTGFYGLLARYPEEDLTVAILTNLGRSPFIQTVERRIARMILGVPQPDFLDAPVPEQEKARSLGSYDGGPFWFDVVPEGSGIVLVARQPDYVDNPLTYWRTRLLYQGGRVFVGADDPDWLQVSFEAGSGPAAEMAVSWPAQTPSQAIRRSPRSAGR